MSMLKYLAFILLVHSTLAFALTRPDLEQMQAELDNPVTLETVETVLLESGLPFMKAKGQNSCQYYYSHSESHVKTFTIAIDFYSYAGKEIIHRINWNSDYSYYEIVGGRFQSSESYYRHAGVSDSVIENRTKLMQLFNSILDKIENGKNLYWPHSGRCEKCAIQMISSYSLSEQLGSRGVCNDGYDSEIKTCNYRIELDDGSIADISVEYMKSDRDDYTPVSLRFNDQDLMESSDNMGMIKTVKIGKQEWMDHNLLYGEGLTGKYGVDIVANKDFSNVTDLDYGHESVSMPSGEMNSWFVMMDLNLRDRNYHDFLEKPDIKENHRGVCPAGFHVPTINEWEELFSFVIKDKVKFLKYNLFEEYAEAKKTYESNCSYFGGCNPAGKKASDKMTKIHKELDSIYDKWRKGRKDGFNCGVGEKCHYNLDDMQNVILREMVRHLCAKNSWPLDENGEDVCLDSYGFLLSSNSKTGDKMNYWTADAKISKCHDIFEEGHHLCTYEITGYGFSVQNQWREFNIPRFESLLGNANLRCLKNGGKK